MNSIINLFIVFIVIIQEGMTKESSRMTALRQRLSKSESLSLPSLGRPFSLGALYNIRTDSVVYQGLKLWDNSRLEKDLLQKPWHYTDAKIVATESMMDKSHAFDMKAELRASFMAGLLKVSGAASYLEEKTESNYEANLAFRYQRKTHMEELTMEHLANVDHPKVFDMASDATHVVTRINYGANVVFEFSRGLKDLKRKKEITGELQLALELVAFSISGGGGIILTEDEKTKYKSFKCKFMGDVQLNHSPITLLEAIKAIQEVPSLINKTTSIPIDVYLMPLSVLDTTNVKLVRQISAYLLNQVGKRMAKYDDLENDIGDLRLSEAYHMLPIFNSHVLDFQSALSGHRIEFSRKMSEILPKIRGKGLAEIELTKMLDDRKSPFRMRALKSWLSSKKREAAALHVLSTWRPNIIITEPQFLQLLFNDDIEYIVSFNIRLYRETDPFTDCLLYQCSDTNIKYKSWMNRKLKRDLRSKLAKFKRIYAQNQEVKHLYNTEFVALENLITDEDDQQLAIDVEIYDIGELAEKSFQFPKITDLAVVAQDCKNTKLTWSVVDSNKPQWIHSGYRVSYQKVNLNNTPDVIDTDQGILNTDMTPSKNIILHGKIPQLMHTNTDARFEVRVMAKCHFGICGQDRITVQDNRPASCNAPVDCDLTAWGQWSECSATCGPQGKHWRMREKISDAQNNGKPCSEYELSQNGECNTTPCAVDCVVSPWKSWSPCSITCGHGTRTRKRVIVTLALNGGKECPKLVEPNDCYKRCQLVDPIDKCPPVYCRSCGPLTRKLSDKQQDPRCRKCCYQ